ncbi:YbaK/EbsC family protein [Lactobacillus helveticus]|uniref:Prolyl-tRNA editing protein ProX n=1 Tax=Lactobacillus helveticus TaxID=1587 RepID=A0A9Q5BYA5_LACHE|nr:YbaK/EbsC family protein [Lactobacillus helveticus]NRN88985.1 Prolyl-tRNA editing protein ProX [Lactobacillus helveticus]NRN93357.1 Prolyl-tRNA editing protein ProX [Lactobacillus helveticus]NRO05802.1 Prolyl-tRNA editing protein ProX [Lactobacillus helveticus]NRO21891.1 Prolyl-tRNA editing protein ProX [Lactobacillus helveticus]NRO25941.1 Prolyl-tRNA editing protein ProX [Lactobacillus helveticus]
MDSQELFSLLDKHDVTYQAFTHTAVSTSKEADQYLKDETFVKCKNLFIKTRDKKSYFLVMLPENKKIDWKKAQKELFTSNLTMADEDELMEKLKVKRGLVSPFSLLNDETNTIPLVIDQEAMEENNFVGVHPNDNTKTISLQWIDLARILSSYGHLVEERSF